MTACNQPHKYRCETCKNPDCPFGVEAKYCVRIIPNIMHKVGCASHSDVVKAEQRIADLELALRSIVREIDSPNYWETSLINIKEKALALLREKGE